jgi:DNA topoisomerase-1
MTSHKKLFIVESPVKARTIEKYLKEERDATYVVLATKGHIADIPEDERGVDVEAGFVPHYELTAQGAKVVAELRKELDGACEVVLATDPDREGELIAAHLVEFLAPEVPVVRVVFHSVTREAIRKALAQPMAINTALVEAAKTRRVLDRLFGYRVTAVGRKLVRPNVTAGRVQSPALRLVVERELLRLAFTSADYFGVDLSIGGASNFEAKLVSVDGTRIATGKDFSAEGVVSGEVALLSAADAERIVVDLLNEGTVTVVDLSEVKATRKPQPPFIMSTLQQEASNRLGMSVTEVERLAQNLFDAGHISYARTDNPVHSAESRLEIRGAVAAEFGVEALHPSERFVTSKKKNTQGAHEAIRPTRLSVKAPAGVTGRELALYELVWRRTLASQMDDAKGVTRTVRLRATADGQVCDFTATTTIYTEPGFRVVYPTLGEGGESRLPELGVGEVLPVAAAAASPHSTQPPARFTEASLVRELEERGIGRPSTYGKIIRKLRDRYVWSRDGEKALIPTLTAFAVHRMLTLHFSLLVDDEFTSAMEDDLERIADGGVALRDAVLEEFFFGGESWPGLEALVDEAWSHADVSALHVLELGRHPETAEPIVVRPGRMRYKSFSPYVECGARRVSLDDQTCLEELTVERALALMDARDAETRVLGNDPDSGLSVLVRPSRGLKGGHFLQVGQRQELPKSTKPRFVTVPEGIDALSLTLGEALEICREDAKGRRVLGSHPEGGEVLAITGQYGPYVKWKKENRSIPEGEDVDSMTINRALELLALPVARRRRRATPRS